ncbi:MAG TPA: histidinol-phosphate transaminase [Polyangia bacterium]|nr:histidinol-phosphate transaminase [Polyangia bacterium]
MPDKPTTPPDPLQLLRPAIRAMPAYTPGEQIADLTKLNTNEAAHPPSPRVMATLAAIADDALRLYPDPVSRKLRQAAATRFGVTAAQVLAGNGADDCLTILYRAFLEPGQRVACPWPTYGLYDTLASLQGAELVRLPFAAADARHLGLPADLARQGAKMIILANPNNPTSTLVSVAALRALCDEARDAIVVVDEAYVDFALAAGIEASMLPFLDAHPNLVVLRTLSKSYSLAGARLGLLFAAAPLVDALMKVKDSYNVNVISQALGVAALEDRAYYDACVRQTVAERARLETALTAMGLTYPEPAANFVLVEVGPRARELYEALKNEGLLVRWWPAPELQTKLRMTVGRPAENDRVIAALRKHL